MSISKDKALAEARVALMQHSPFWSVLMYRTMRFSWDETIPTAATDGRRLMVNPEFFCSLPVEGRMFVLAHEVGHALFKHTDVFNAYKGKLLAGKPFNRTVMNYAQDFIINALLHDSGMEFAENFLIDKIKFPATMSAMEVYRKLMEEVEQQQQQQQSGGAGDGEGQSGRQGGGDGDNDSGGSQSGSNEGLGSEYDDKQFDDHRPAQSDTLSPAQWKQAVAEAAQAQKLRGKLPAAIEALVEEFMEPKLDWREQLRTSMLSSAKGDTSTWSRPNRRAMMLFDQYLPSDCDITAGCVVVGVDTSGSVSDAELQRFMSEVAGILSDAKPTELWLLSVDAKVHRAKFIEDPVELEQFAREDLIGRGGTDMTKIFEWVDDNAMQPDRVVVLTDGYTPFGEQPMYPVTWAMTSDVTAPFGDTVHVVIEE